MQAEAVTGPVAGHGEGPVWSDGWGGLRWVDQLAGDVLHLEAGGGVLRRHVAPVVAAVRPRRGGGAVLGVERGFALEAPDGTVEVLPPLWDHAGERMNEGGCDPDGRFYCGSMVEARRPTGRLHRLDPDGTVTTVLGGVTVSNGLDWSPDGTVAYYVDTATGRIDVFGYDVDTGLTGRRPFVVVPDADGHPDGLVVDAEGGVWVALHRGGQVRRYDADGDLDAVVEVPVPRVTACTFGGPALDELYITTSKAGEGPGDTALAGALFRAHVGVRGRPVRPYGG